ncbi:antitoxin Xre/MbcA/ParS toxin-binding domain-containing protein [Marinovum sp.]|uniref:antitoxin Xre/MbcA/ParS toxin-binding domain-containing protein n=1 Tax=Marinovum sp. TaxID=2024839 RepID=UPI003A900F03
MTLVETIVSITSVIASVLAILYMRHIARHAGRDRPHDPERLRRFIETAPYEDDLRVFATAVLGSKEAAQAWMVRPAPHLDGHRPIDLVATPAGARAVRHYLTRLKQTRDGWRTSTASV